MILIITFASCLSSFLLISPAFIVFKKTMKAELIINGRNKTRRCLKGN